MIQVKVFDEEHEDDLTLSVNRFLSKCNDEILSIRFSTAMACGPEEQYYCFSAMVIYRIAEEE